MVKETSSERFRRTLIARGFGCELVELPQSARTAPQAAAAVGCNVAQIAKSLVFRGKVTGRPVLVIASGANRVDEAVLAELIAEPVDKADAEFTRRHTGFAIGGIPPTCHVERLRTFIDADLLQYPEIWAAAGTPHAVFRLSPDDLRKMTDGTVAAIS